jgi:hypothetical protein
MGGGVYAHRYTHGGPPRPHLIVQCGGPPRPHLIVQCIVCLSPNCADVIA